MEMRRKIRYRTHRKPDEQSVDGAELADGY
jgi:hypothetical protein